MVIEILPCMQSSLLIVHITIIVSKLCYHLILLYQLYLECLVSFHFQTNLISISLKIMIVRWLFNINEKNDCWIVNLNSFTSA